MWNILILKNWNIKNNTTLANDVVQGIKEQFLRLAPERGEFLGHQYIQYFTDVVETAHIPHGPGKIQLPKRLGKTYISAALEHDPKECVRTVSFFSEQSMKMKESK